MGGVSQVSDTSDTRVGEHPERRVTRQRAALSEALSDQTTFQSAQEIHAQLKEAGASVGLATVYRNLQAMVADGELDVLRSDDGETVYRRCSPSHHHHLVCRVCGHTVEVKVPEVEQICRVAATIHGFTGIDHVLEIFGTCPSCAARSSAQR